VYIALRPACGVQNVTYALSYTRYQKWLAVVLKVGGTAPLEAVRNSRGAVKQKWAVGGR